jgi:hypothetical protein
MSLPRRMRFDVICSAVSRDDQNCSSADRLKRAWPVREDFASSFMRIDVGLMRRSTAGRGCPFL